MNQIMNQDLLHTESSDLLDKIYCEYEEHSGTLITSTTSFYKLCDAEAEGGDCLKCTIAKHLKKVRE